MRSRNKYLNSRTTTWALMAILIFACGKKDSEETTTTTSVNQRTDPVHSPQPDPQDPGGPKPGPIRLLEIPGRALTKKENKDLFFPYASLFVKKAALHQSRKHKKCSPGYSDVCTVNRQVAFAFDLDSLKNENPHTLEIVDMRLHMNLYSVLNNKQSEMICSLDYRVCSGQGRKQDFWTTTFVQDGTFWKKGYEKTVISSLFQDLLNKAPTDQGLYLASEAEFSLMDLFHLQRDTFKEYAFLKDTLKYVVTDDTYVEEPVLRVYMRDVQ